MHLDNLGIGGLVAFALAWVLAHVVKVAIVAVKNKRLGVEELKHLIKSGGMPSAHTATMTALATYFGILYGFDSGMFALSAAVLLIVAYDAMNVRKAVGEYGELLRKAEKNLKIVRGHTLAEVIVGAVVGIVVGQAVALMFAVV